MVQNMRQDGSHNNHQGAERTETVTFAGELKKVMEKDANNDCYTVTYNSDMKLQSFYYTEQREYSRTL